MISNHNYIEDEGRPLELGLQGLTQIFRALGQGVRVIERVLAECVEQTDRRRVVELFDGCHA